MIVQHWTQKYAVLEKENRLAEGKYLALQKNIEDRLYDSNDDEEDSLDVQTDKHHDQMGQRSTSGGVKKRRKRKTRRKTRRKRKSRRKTRRKRKPRRKPRRKTRRKR